MCPHALVRRRSMELYARSFGASEDDLKEMWTFVMRRLCLVLFCLLLGVSNAGATIFGTVRGVVHDPQHRPIPGAHVTLKAQTSDWTQSQGSSGSGEVEFRSVD